MKQENDPYKLNYKMLPKQELFHRFGSLRFQKFTSYLGSMNDELLKEYIVVLEQTPNYCLFGGARG